MADLDEEIRAGMATGAGFFTPGKEYTPTQIHSDGRALILTGISGRAMLARSEHKEASQYCTICKKYGHKNQFCRAEGHLANIPFEQPMVERKAVMTRLLGRSYSKFNESWGSHVFPMICLVVHDSVTNLLCRKDESGNEVKVFCRVCDEDITEVGICDHLFNCYKDGRRDHGKAPPLPDNLNLISSIPLITPWGTACVKQMQYHGGLAHNVGLLLEWIQGRHSYHPELKRTGGWKSTSSACVCDACSVIDSHRMYKFRRDRDGGRAGQDQIFYGLPLPYLKSDQHIFKLDGPARYKWLKVRTSYMEQRHKFQ